MTISVPIWLQGGSYNAQRDRQIVAATWDEGVRSIADCKVTQRGAGANFSVDVAVGEFVIKGDDQANQGNYLGQVTAVENAVIGAAPGANSRYDIVCLRVNDPNAGGSAGNNVTVVVTAGVVAASPVVPAVPNSSLLLAVVGPITSGTVSITNALIHDCSTGTGPAEALNALRPWGKIDDVGTTKDFYGPSTLVPNGWLLCAGQNVSRTTYSRLFATLGTAFGVGDGSTTFGLPDRRGRVAVALDNMGGSDAGRLTAANTLGGTGGAETHTLTQAELPAHVHTVDPPETRVKYDGGILDGADVEVGDVGSGIASLERDNANGASYYYMSVDIAPFNTGNIGSGSAHNNMQPYILTNVIIRT